MSEFYTWTILLMNQLGKIGEKQLSVFGSKGGQICPLMQVPLWDSYLKTRDMLILKTRSRSQWPQIRYPTLPHLKMHLHEKFGIPTTKNVGDMHRTQKGRADGQCLPKFFGCIKTRRPQNTMEATNTNKLLNHRSSRSHWGLDEILPLNFGVV